MFLRLVTRLVGPAFIRVAQRNQRRGASERGGLQSFYILTGELADNLQLNISFRSWGIVEDDNVGVHH